MSSILEPATWIAAIALLLSIGEAHSKVKQMRVQILQQLRDFKWRLKYTPQENSPKGVDAIQNEMLGCLDSVKANMVFSSILCSFRYEREIFLDACRLYMRGQEGVSLEDVIAATIDLIDAIIKSMNI